MTRTRRLVAAALLAALSPAVRAQEAPKAPERTPEERRKDAEELFARFDKNRDLTLKGDEIPAPGWLERYDRDGDDEITKKEMLEIVDRGPGYDRLFLLRDPRARARNAGNQFDQDKDGFVSAEEYPGDALRRRMKSPGKYEFLALFDLNYDRQVTLAEYDGPTRAFRKYDENADGVVDFYEIYPERRPEAMERQGPEPEDLNVLSTLDANGDGRVGRDEWKGSAAAWKRLDRNGDGWITTADAR